MKTYLTHNNAFDSVVTMDNGRLVIAVNIDSQIWIDYHSDNPDFGNWSGEYNDNCNSPDDYGTVYATRKDNDPIQIIDDELYYDRKEFFEQR